MITEKSNKYLQVDHAALKKAFLYFAKVINENGAQKKIYIEDGKNCLACGTCYAEAADGPHGPHTHGSNNADTPPTLATRWRNEYEVLTKGFDISVCGIIPYNLRMTLSRF